MWFYSVKEDKPEEKVKVNKSVTKERKKLAKLRAEHRKAVLNSENCYQYRQLSDGSLLQGIRLALIMLLADY